MPVKYPDSSFSVPTPHEPDLEAIRRLSAAMSTTTTITTTAATTPPSTVSSSTMTAITEAVTTTMAEDRKLQETFPSIGEGHSGGLYDVTDERDSDDNFELEQVREAPTNSTSTNSDNETTYSQNNKETIFYNGNNMELLLSTPTLSSNNVPLIDFSTPDHLASIDNFFDPASKTSSTTSTALAAAIMVVLGVAFLCQLLTLVTMVIKCSRKRRRGFSSGRKSYQSLFANERLLSSEQTASRGRNDSCRSRTSSCRFKQDRFVGGNQQETEAALVRNKSTDGRDNVHPSLCHLHRLPLPPPPRLLHIPFISRQQNRHNKEHAGHRVCSGQCKSGSSLLTTSLPSSTASSSSSSSSSLVAGFHLSNFFLDVYFIWFTAFGMVLICSAAMLISIDDVIFRVPSCWLQLYPYLWGIKQWSRYSILWLLVIATLEKSLSAEGSKVIGEKNSSISQILRKRSHFEANGCCCQNKAVGRFGELRVFDPTNAALTSNLTPQVNSGGTKSFSHYGFRFNQASCSLSSANIELSSTAVDPFNPSRTFVRESLDRPVAGERHPGPRDKWIKEIKPPFLCQPTEQQAMSFKGHKCQSGNLASCDLVSTILMSKENDKKADWTSKSSSSTSNPLLINQLFDASIIKQKPRGVVRDAETADCESDKDQEIWQMRDRRSMRVRTASASKEKIVRDDDRYASGHDTNDEAQKIKFEEGVDEGKSHAGYDGKKKKKKERRSLLMETCLICMVVCLVCFVSTLPDFFVYEVVSCSEESELCESIKQQRAENQTTTTSSHFTMLTTTATVAHDADANGQQIVQNNHSSKNYDEFLLKSNKDIIDSWEFSTVYFWYINILTSFLPHAIMIASLVKMSLLKIQKKQSKTSDEIGLDTLKTDEQMFASIGKNIKHSSQKKLPTGSLPFEGNRISNGDTTDRGRPENYDDDDDLRGRRRDFPIQGGTENPARKDGLILNVGNLLPGILKGRSDERLVDTSAGSMDASEDSTARKRDAFNYHTCERPPRQHRHHHRHNLQHHYHHHHHHHHRHHHFQPQSHRCSCCSDRGCSNVGLNCGEDDDDYDDEVGGGCASEHGLNYIPNYNSDRYVYGNGSEEDDDGDDDYDNDGNDDDNDDDDNECCPGFEVCGGGCCSRCQRWGQKRSCSPDDGDDDDNDYDDDDDYTEEANDDEDPCYDFCNRSCDYREVQYLRGCDDHDDDVDDDDDDDDDGRSERVKVNPMRAKDQHGGLYRCRSYFERDRRSNNHYQNHRHNYHCKQRGRLQKLQRFDETSFLTSSQINDNNNRVVCFQSDNCTQLQGTIKACVHSHMISLDQLPSSGPNDASSSCPLIISRLSSLPSIQQTNHPPSVEVQRQSNKRMSNSNISRQRTRRLLQLIVALSLSHMALSLPLNVFHLFHNRHGSGHHPQLFRGNYKQLQALNADESPANRTTTNNKNNFYFTDDETETRCTSRSPETTGGFNYEGNNEQPPPDDAENKFHGVQNSISRESPEIPTTVGNRNQVSDNKGIEVTSPKNLEETFLNANLERPLTQTADRKIPKYRLGNKDHKSITGEVSHEVMDSGGGWLDESLLRSFCELFYFIFHVLFFPLLCCHDDGFLTVFLRLGFCGNKHGSTKRQKEVQFFI